METIKNPIKCLMMIRRWDGEVIRNVSTVKRNEFLRIKKPRLDDMWWEECQSRWQIVIKTRICFFLEQHVFLVLNSPENCNSFFTSSSFVISLFPRIWFVWCQVIKEETQMVFKWEYHQGSSCYKKCLYSLGVYPKTSWSLIKERLWDTSAN